MPTQEQMDTYRIVNDPSLDQAGKQQALTMLYGGGPAAPAPLPDQSVAQIDPSSVMAGSGGDPSQAPPAPPPVATDAGGMSSPPPPTMSVAPPVSMPQPVPPPAPEANSISMPTGYGAEVPAAAAPVPQQAPDPEAGMNNLVANAVAQEARGYAGRRVEAHDQPISTTVTSKAIVPDEMKEKLAASQQAEEGLALKAGDTMAANKEDEAKELDRIAFNENAEENAYQFEVKKREQQFSKAQDDYGKLVEDTKAKPGEWWSSKTTGQKIMTGFAALLFGLARDSDGVDRMIKADADMREANRNKTLNAAHERLGDLKSRLSDPEAARKLHLATSYHVAATEMQRLGASAASPEIRDKAAAYTQEYITKAQREENEVWSNEHGAMTTQIAHIPTQVVGGRAPNVLRGIKAGKEAGLSPEGITRALSGGQYENGDTPDEAKRRVTFADGHVGYVGNEAQQNTTQEGVLAIEGLQGTYARIRKLSESAGHTIAGPEKARLEANIAAGMQKLQAMAKGEGANARMAGEMLEKLSPLTGANSVATGMTDASARAQLDEALRIVTDQKEQLKGTLTPSPKTKPVGGKIQTLGASQEDLGFKKE